MRTAGIVAEFDPFHNGHAYLLRRVRESGALRIVCAMSGDLLQRGGVALLDKQQRAECALSCGADLIIELTAPFSCACSEIFAGAAVKLLAAAGADTIAFGSEITDVSLLERCADISLKIANSPRVAELTAEGSSYPSAVSRVISEDYGSEYAEVFSQPNATLGIEYIKAARRYGIKEFLPIKRAGAAHDSGQTEGRYASASYIRELIRQGGDAAMLTPIEYKSEPKAYIENMAGHILFTLCTADVNKLRSCPDCSSIIAERIIKLSRSRPSDLGELFSRLKSKDVTLARLRRVALYLSAGLEDITADELSAARVLAFNEKGSTLLRAAKESEVTLTTSLSRVQEICPKAAINTERAAYFRYLCTDRKTLPTNEFTRQIKIKKGVFEK